MIYALAALYKIYDVLNNVHIVLLCMRESVYMQIGVGVCFLYSGRTISLELADWGKNWLALASFSVRRRIC